MSNIIKHIPIVVSTVILFGILIFFHFRGVTYYDEGYILNAALRVAHGEMPYKDFDMVYTPLSFVLTSAFIMLFGESVMAGRIAALTLSIFSLFALFSLLQLITKQRLIILGSLLFFIAWGPAHINFTWPTMFAICFFLYAALFYCYGIEKKSSKYFLLAGIMTALTFLSKQNFGVGTFAVLTITFLILHIENKGKLLIHYLSGIFISAFLYIIFLIFTASLIPFLQNMYLYTLKRVFLDRSIETPFLYDGPLFLRIAKLLFYTSPLIIAVGAFILSIKSKSKLLVLPLLTAMFYLLGIRPTTDYVHVVSLLAIACIPFAMIMTMLKNKVFISAASCVFTFLILLGFYTAYFKGYYQWEAPIRENTSFVSNGRVKVYLTEQQSQETNRVIKYIHSRVAKDEFIFVNYYAPLIYFVTDRNNPTPYDLISTNQLPLMYQMKIIDALIEKDVKLIVTDDLNKNEKGIVTDFVKKKYVVTKKIGPFILYEKVR